MTIRTKNRLDFDSLIHYNVLLKLKMKQIDVKSKSIKELKGLAKDLREQILEILRQNGGHLSSNLGVVELSIALNYVFDSQKDYINFDVGHQCYAHKIINGRDLSSLRQFGGASGFPSFEENKMDCVSSGHSGS